MDQTDKTEKALRASELRYRTLLEAGADAVILAKFDGKTVRITDCNHVGLEMFALTREQMLGKTPFDLSPSTQSDGRLSEEYGIQLAEKALAGTPQLFVWQHIRQDGVVFDVEIRLHRVDLPDGAQLQAVIRDITDRKRVEEELRSSEERYRSLFDRVPVGLYRTTSDGQIQAANAALVRMLGFPDTETLLATNARELYGAPGDRKRMLREIDSTGVALNLEFQLQRFDGSSIWVRENVRKVAEDGGVGECFEGSLEDITAQKNAEIQRDRFEFQMRQAHKLQAVGQLAAGVAHDFNSLLMVILGNLELLKAKYGSSDSEKDGDEATSWDRIFEAVDRGTSLIRKLLVVGRTEKSRAVSMDPKRAIVDMDSMLRGLLDSRIDVQIRLASDAGRIHIDAGQFQQVLMNLVLNARDALPEGGTLGIETANVTLNSAHVSDHPDAHPGPHVVVTVSDTGEGMSKATMERLFEPFFSMKPVNQGAGLGLAIVHGIVQNAGGHIEVESERGKGSRFQLYFPAVMGGEDHVKVERRMLKD